MHGELYNIPWQFSVLRDDPDCVQVKFWARTCRTPFYMERTFGLEGDRAVLSIHEKLINEGQEDMELMWGYHPAFGAPFLSEHCRIDIPAKKVEVCSQAAPNTRLDAGKQFDWPIVRDRDGNDLDLSRIAPPSAKAADMAYLLELEEGWYAITNNQLKVGFGLRYPKEIFPYVWYWMDYEGEFGYPFYGRTYVVALEPFTSYPRFGLEEAIKRGTAMKMAAGETVEANLKAVAYDGVGKVDRITEQGEVQGK